MSTSTIILHYFFVPNVHWISFALSLITISHSEEKQSGLTNLYSLLCFLLALRWRKTWLNQEERRLTFITEVHWGKKTQGNPFFWVAKLLLFYRIFRFYGVNYIWMFGHILAMSNSCCNPFIYGIYNVSLSIFACIIADPKLRIDFSSKRLKKAI